jgi:hypothetical protein
MYKTTDINKKRSERTRTVSRTSQESAHTAMNYAFKAQEMNTELLRRTSQAWIEGFRYQARLSQGMAQAFFGHRGNASESTAHVERPAREQSSSGVTEPATNGAQKATGPAAEETTQKSTEVAAEDAEETQKSTEIAAKDAQKNTETGAFPIEGYDEMNVGEVSERLDGLSEAELKRVGKWMLSGRGPSGLRPLRSTPAR